MNRSSMREETFKILYSMQIQGNENKQEQIKLYIENNNIHNEEAKKYIEDAIFGIENNKEEIDEQIKKNLKENWKIERVSKIDLSILRLAIYEIKYKEIPYKVAINEAVELAKKYSDDKVKNMINGVLDKVYHEKIA